MTVEITYATPIPIKSIKATCIYDAAALIVAEIERLDRVAATGAEKQEGGNV